MWLFPLFVGIAFSLLCRWIVARLLGYRDDALFPRRGPAWRRLLVAAAVPLLLLPLSIAGTLAIYAVAGVPQPEPHMLISHVKEGSPASRAGLFAGDRLVMVDGQAVSASSPVAPMVAATGDRPFSVVVLRNGERSEVRLTAEDGRIGLGLAPEVVYVRSVGQVLRSGFADPLRYYGNAFVSVAESMGGERTYVLGGPIAIVRMAPDPVNAARWMLWGVSLSAMLLGLLLGLLLFALARPPRTSS